MLSGASATIPTPSQWSTSAHAMASPSTNCDPAIPDCSATWRAASRVPTRSNDMSGEIWFLFLMFGLKAPVLGIGYFFYRVLRWHEDEWEQLGWNAEPPDSDDGGRGRGGSDRLPPWLPRPRGGLETPRRPERRPPRSTSGRPHAPTGRPGRASRPTRTPGSAESVRTINPDTLDQTSTARPSKEHDAAVAPTDARNFV